MVKQIIVSNELHKLIKIRASEEDKSIKELVTEIIEDYLDIKPEDYRSADKNE